MSKKGGNKGDDDSARNLFNSYIMLIFKVIPCFDIVYIS